MSPYQVQSLLEEFLQEHLLFADVHSPDHLELSEDGRRSAKEGIPPEVTPKSSGWVEPRQVLALVEDKDPLAAVVEYEMQRRAARFMSTAKPPTNPLPPFLRVRDHKTDSESGESPSEAEPSKGDAELAAADLPMREAASPEDDLLQKVEKEKEVKDLLSEAKEEEPPALSQEAESDDALEKQLSTEIREGEEKEKPEQREARPTTAQLLDFDVEDKLIISGERVACQEMVYNLRDGYNLISFCCEQPLSVDNLPLGCTRIIGESNASIYSNNNRVGGLNELESGRGYWIHCDESVDFNWDCSE